MSTQEARAIPPEAQPILRATGVTMTFAGLKALDDVSFLIPEGSVCGIIGPNGAGKSTLLNVISGVYRPDSGHVEFAGTRLPPGPRQIAARGVARTFQNVALFKGMSALDNLVAGLNLTRRAGLVSQALRLPAARREQASQEARADELLRFLELEHVRDAVVGTLPYGVQKRVELGRALVASPRLLLLDEPMAGMTAAEKSEMCEFVLEVNRTRGTSVVLIEHDLGVVMRLARKLVVLDYGRLIADGPPEQIVNDPRVAAAYLGPSTDGEV